MAGIEHEILNIVASIYNALGWTGVVVMMAIESACIPLPSEVVMPLAGWMLINAKGLGLEWVVLAGVYGAIGNVTGSLIAYVVGARGGRPLIERYGRYLLISSHDLERADAWFAKYGLWAVFFSRMLPVVRTFISFPAGVARVRLAPFVLLTFAGAFPWSLGLAYGGYQLGEHWEALRSVMRPFDFPIIAVILLLVALYVYRHVRRAIPQTQTD